eukprot:9051984-Prorocentrum_lima.AAC.1
MGEISMLLQTIVGGEPEAYMPLNLIGGLNNLNNYRRNYGISMGFLPELVPSYICLLYTSDAADDM